MYSINGVPLDRDPFWWLEGRTKTIQELDESLSGVTVQGRAGVVPVPSSPSAPMWPIYMRVQRAHVEALSALFRAGGSISYTANPARSVGFSLAGRSIQDELYVGGWAIVLFTVRLDGAFWRDTTESTSTAASLASASVAVTGLFPGLSGSVQDMVVRVKGVTTGLQVTDTAGSWFTYAPALTGSQWLRFEAASGRAFITSTDVWTGGADVSGAVDFGGDRGIFEITPRLAPADPSSRDGRLTVATATRTGATIQVRGRGAYLV